MTGAALRASQAVPCVGRDLPTRHLSDRQAWVNVRVGDSRVAARFARLGEPGQATSAVSDSPVAQASAGASHNSTAIPEELYVRGAIPDKPVSRAPETPFCWRSTWNRSPIPSG